jgi:hypothetical protein
MDLPQESTIDLDGRDFMRWNPWFPTTGRHTECPSWSKPLFAHTLQPAGVSFSPKIGWLKINKTYQLRIHWPLLKILDIPPNNCWWFADFSSQILGSLASRRRKHYFWGAQFSFSSADVLCEVPYDPQLQMSLSSDVGFGVSIVFWVQRISATLW